MNTVSSRAGKPNTALVRTHTTTAATAPSASVGLAAHRSTACRTRLPGWRSSTCSSDLSCTGWLPPA